MLAALQNWERLAWLCAAAVLFGLIGHFFVFGLLRGLVKRIKSTLDDSFVKYCFRPLLWIIILIIIRLVSKLTAFQTQVSDFLNTFWACCLSDWSHGY